MRDTQPEKLDKIYFHLYDIMEKNKTIDAENRSVVSKD